MSRRRKKLHISPARRALLAGIERPVRSDLSHVVCVGDEFRLYAVFVEETGQGMAFCALCGAVVDLDFGRPVRQQLCDRCLAAAA